VEGKHRAMRTRPKGNGPAVKATKETIKKEYEF